MLRSIEQSRNRRLEKLRGQMEEYQGMLENSGLVGYAQEVLKETDQSCFVQTAKQLHTRFAQFLHIPLPLPITQTGAFPNTIPLMTHQSTEIL